MNNEQAFYFQRKRRRHRRNASVAHGQIQFSDNANDGETVTIGGKVYTFQDELTNVDGHVLIGDGAAASVSNLAEAINGGGDPGTNYAAATTRGSWNASQDGPTLAVQALSSGTGGNTISLETTCKSASWSTPHMTGGR